MDFDLPEETRLLRDTVRRFVDRELIPLEPTIVDDKHELPPETMARLQDKAREIGLWLLDVPTEFGGAGLDVLSQCIVAEEIGRTSALPFRTPEIFGPDVRPILYSCNDEQKDRFLYPVIRGELKVCFAQTEPDAGSDPGSMKTRALREGDEYVLNGSKRFISHAGTADYAQVIALTDPSKGSRGGISCLMVDLRSPGVTVTPQGRLLVDDTTYELSFTDVRVPATNRIGEEGQGFELGQEWITMGRIRGHGARPVGIAGRALEMMSDYARQRVTFGAPLADRQAVQFMIADSAMELESTRLMVYRCAWEADQGRDVRDLSYMVKIMATEMAFRVLDRAIQVHGGMGLSSELPLEWWFRQIRSLRITEGATEVLRWRLARNLMRKR
jgi:acyl-CoA dehydrogenase